MNKVPLQNNLASYLSELEELFNVEFGTDIAERSNSYLLDDKELMIIFFALKQYLATAIVQGTTSQVIVTTTKLIESLMPSVQAATSYRLNYMKQEVK